MVITFHNELIPHFEAYVLLSHLVNRKTPDLLRSRLRGMGFDHEAATLLDDLSRIYKQAEEHLFPLNLKVSALFLSHCKGAFLTSGADLLAHPYMPDQLHVLSERFDMLTEEQRQSQLFECISAMIGKENAPLPKDIPSLISLLEESSFGASLKYEILLLCCRAIESASLLQVTLNRTLWSIAGLVKLFRNETVELMETLSAVENFTDYVYQKTGINLAGKEDIHVYPSALLLDVSYLEYRSGARAPSVSLFWGVRFHALSLLNAKVGVLSENLGASLRAISERTKLNILLALRKRPHYGAELANLLGIKPATVSHHIKELLQYDLVKIEPKQNRLYYALSATRVQEALKVMMEFLEPW